MKLTFNLYIDGCQVYDLKNLPLIVGQKIRFNREFRRMHVADFRIDYIEKIDYNPYPKILPKNVLVWLKRSESTIDISYILRNNVYIKL